MPSDPALTPAKLTDLDDTIKIIRLRRAGFSMYECSETTGIPLKKVRSLLQEAAKELGILRTEEADALRAVENDRLDEMLRAVWERASQGSIAHIQTVLRIMERRSKLLALDLKPDQIHIGDNIVTLPEWAVKKPEQEEPVIEITSGEQSES